MSDQMIHLAVDLLGADTPEEELCRGAVRALVGNPALFLHLCGHADVLSAVTAEIGAAEIAGRYEIVDAPVALSNNEDPMQAYQRTDASLCAAMRLAHEGAAGGVITCGATGAVLVTSIMILGKLPRLRPILAVELTNPAGEPLLLLDCGANIDSRPELYPAFAHLGDAYMRCIGCSSPRIALLSNGAEAKKGCEAVKAAHALLAEQPFRFVGNIEATSALRGTADVIVCDGFHGNILLKSIEGSAKAALDEVSARLSAAGLESAAVADILATVRRRYDYNTQGGALLLGVRKPVMKGHGSATGEAIVHMADRLALLCRNRFIERVAETVR
ncbi:MAG: phosphate acyltransferase [Eubacteriales bacterium]|mgnify:FL=1|nr:phosphate acyltransferase [Oscillospiraceae bacterium]MDY3925568.1 phosphate acyltransferase [Eubacteriales bacterium]